MFIARLRQLPKSWDIDMNMFKPVNATSIQEYFSMLEGERKDQIVFLDRLIKETVPTLKPVFSYNMLGYGTFEYKNAKKQIIDWPTISLASQKNYISVYICSVMDGQYLAETHKDKLGKVSVGKSCIRFKKIEDVNLDELKKVIQLAEKNPGLTGLEHK